jgi:DsbC/DsbD-like thiol-disulfide interchange protein/cytochrome c biogenesis protein CcdA
LAVLQIVAAFALLFATAGPALAANRIAAELLVERPARGGETVDAAIHFRSEPGWHGYWANPGDAGFGMKLEWTLPQGASAGPPQYPVPHTLLINGLMNHIYEQDYAVLVPLRLPAGIAGDRAIPIAVKADWLACTDTICVPESAVLSASLVLGSGPGNPKFDGWRSAIPPLLASAGRFAAKKDRLRVAIALPRDEAVTEPHLFVETGELVDYAAAQSFFRKGDWLIAELKLRPGAPALPDKVTGILRTRQGTGFAFEAQAGKVPAGGIPIVPGQGMPGLAMLALAALAGGLLLNLMPCVFPILSLKALSLARAGESEAQARAEGVAYTAGTIATSLALGGILLVLRAGGEQVGWAFQLQDPRIVVGLLLLAVAITASFAGLFAMSGPSLEQGKSGGAFATGLLAAFVATPCTGPFMAAALGAALLLPPLEALVLFAALGLGLGLPFLLLGWAPPLRKLLPRPGAWMERFRRWMALPMGLTALALGWLVWRLGGAPLLALASALTVALLILLFVAGQRQRRGLGLASSMALGTALLAAVATFGWPERIEAPSDANAGIIQAQPFSEEALARARASGKPVFVWFTADWCITCKVNERVAIERQATRAAFEKAGVVTLRGDWTRRDPTLTRFLTQHGAAGVPLYLWYQPSGESEKLDQLLAPDSLVELARRRVR